MGLFDFFHNKSSNEDSRQAFIGNLMRKYFNGSKEKLHADAKELLVITEYDLSKELLASLFLRCLGFQELKASWNQETLNILNTDCGGKLPEIELKWIYDYCDLHYVHKNPAKEWLLLQERAGRQIGMPAPHELFSERDADNSSKVSTSFIKSSIDDLKENFDFNESFKKHALTYMILQPETSFLCKDEKMDTLWAYIKGDLFCDKEHASTMGAGAFMWLMQKYKDREEFCWILDVLNKECIDLWSQGINKSTDELIADIKQYLPDFKLGNDPETVKTSLQWSWIDIQSLLTFFKYCTLYSNVVLQNVEVVANLRDCLSIVQLTRLYLSDFNITGSGVKEEEKKELSEADKRRAELARKALAETRGEVSDASNVKSEPVIINSWSLIDFAKENGNLKVLLPHTHIVPATGKYNEDAWCAFCHRTKKDEKGKPIVTFVDFSPRLGVLTPEEIVAQKNDLIIIQYDNGTYELTNDKNQVDNNIHSHEEINEEIKTEQLEEIEDFELPDGSIYNGQGKVQFGSLELCGHGEIRYPNGEKYNGEFKYGRPLGWGKYTFSNGHTHKGYFDSVPNGLGYLNEDYSMAVGYFERDYDGDINKCRLNGWGISYRNRIFKFGYWKNGKLVKNETNNTLWIRKQISNERNYYHGNLIQIGKEYDFIRLGIPPRLLGEKVPDIPVEKIPKTPAWGFEFYKDGSVKVGAIRNHDSGEFTMYYPDGTSEIGKWKDGVKIASFLIGRLQKSVDEYRVDGLDVF